MTTKENETMQKLIAMCVFAVLLSAGLSVYADTVQWAPATEREDGTPLQINEIIGHRVYFSDGVSGVYPNSTWVPMPSTSSIVPKGAGFDRHAVVTTVDSDNRESAYSVEVTITGEIIIIADPLPPTNIEVLEDETITIEPAADP